MFEEEILIYSPIKVYIYIVSCGSELHVFLHCFEESSIKNPRLVIQAHPFQSTVLHPILATAYRVSAVTVNEIEHLQLPRDYWDKRKAIS